jgi:hypothetical protein
MTYIIDENNTGNWNKDKFRNKNQLNKAQKEFHLITHAYRHLAP